MGTSITRSIFFANTGYVSSDGQRKTVTVSNSEQLESLTNIQTKSDAWGKVIPIGFGRHRVAGALIWASDFYATASSYDQTTEVQDIYTSHTFQIGVDQLAMGAGGFARTELPPQDVSRPPVTQVSHYKSTSSSIDLCYSFGLEGDTRQRRYVDKIRVNDVLVYDDETGYIAPGIAFSVRYGYDDTILPGMAQYTDGKYMYKGQTLVMFNRFPTANFGNSIPSSVDVEFGCSKKDDPLFCYFSVPYQKQANGLPMSIGNDEFTLKKSYLLVMVVAQDPSQPSVVASGWDIVNEYVVQGKAGVRICKRQMSDADALKLIAGGKIECTTGPAQAVLTVFTVEGFGAFSGAPLSSATTVFHEKGIPYEPADALGPAYGLLVFTGMDTRVMRAAGGFVKAPAGPFAEGAVASPDASGYTVSRIVVRDPCQLGPV